MERLSVLLNKSRQILETEGFVPLVKRGFSFAVGHLFKYETYYLYEWLTKEYVDLNEADFKPRINNFVFKVVYTNQEANELEAEGFKFRSHVIGARDRLDAGAIAFCIFIEHELAEIGWAAFTHKAKDSLNEPPYRIDFSKHEACTGGVWTNPKYRKMRLHMYGRLKRSYFIRDSGVKIHRTAILRGNAIPIKLNTRFDALHGEGRYLKILWWKSWKEKPLTYHDETETALKDV